MTLLELLVKELPGRGGWPDMAEVMVQDCDDGLVKTSIGNPFFKRPCWEPPANGWGVYHGDISGLEVASDADTAIVTREQYEAALQPVWNGEGLPPIGCECEVNDERTDSWSLVDSVLAHACVHGRDVAVFQIADYIAFSPADRFRRIRTEAERKREEAISFMCENFRAIIESEDEKMTGQKAVFASFYDAILSGKIPGIRLSDD